MDLCKTGVPMDLCKTKVSMIVEIPVWTSVGDQSSSLPPEEHGVQKFVGPLGVLEGKPDQRDVFVADFGSACPSLSEGDRKASPTSLNH